MELGTPATSGVRDVLLRAIGTVLHRDVSGVTDSTRLYEDLNLDSATVLQVLIELEGDLGLDLDPEYLVPEDLSSVGSLLKYIGRAGGGR